jgi:hypothetical protein
MTSGSRKGLGIYPLTDRLSVTARDAFGQSVLPKPRNNSHFTARHIFLKIRQSNAKMSESESELIYDQRFTANQFVLATSPLRLQPNTCGYSPYVTSALTRGWVSRLQLLMVLASSVILMSESSGTRNHILCCLRFETPPTWRARSTYL